MEEIRGLVSVIIPTYRRSVLLPRAIASLRGQTYRDVEILVVNDNVPGDEYSAELFHMMERFADDQNVRLIEQEKHINGAAARNAGIRNARGEFLAFLDDDDYYEPEKIELQVKAFAGLPEDYGMVGCLVKTYRGDTLIRASLPYPDGDILFDVMTRVTALGMGSVLIRRSVLADVGGFDEALKRHQDLQLFAVICQKYKVKLVRRYLYDVDIADVGNRPQAPAQLIAIKKAFFDSIRPVMESLSTEQRKVILRSHDFELIPVCLRSGDRKASVRLLLGLLACPTAFYLAMKRTYIRFISGKCRNTLAMKYR